MSNKVRIFKDEAEVTEYWKEDKENNQVVIFKGVVYDKKTQLNNKKYIKFMT